MSPSWGLSLFAILSWVSHSLRLPIAIPRKRAHAFDDGCPTPSLMFDGTEHDERLICAVRPGASRERILRVSRVQRTA